MSRVSHNWSPHVKKQGKAIGAILLHVGKVSGGFEKVSGGFEKVSGDLEGVRWSREGVR